MVTARWKLFKIYVYIYIYIYIYIYKSVRLISVKQCSIHVSRAEYKVEKKIQTDYTFISTSLFRGCPLVRSDEWATTKQACRDKRVVRLNLFLYLIYIYIYKEMQMRIVLHRISGVLK